MSDTSPGFGDEIPSEASFLFEVDGVQIGLFAQVSGLELQVDVVTYREGGVNGFVHKLPGSTTWPHIILKRGVTDSDALFQWATKTSGAGFSANGNKLVRNSGAITALSSNGTRLRAWNLEDVFAVRWTGPRFESGSGKPLAEELELAHHGFTSKTF